MSHLAYPLFSAPAGPDITPYNIDPDRVFIAAFRQAVDANSSARVTWSDVPNQVAFEQFRLLLATHTFDDLTFTDVPNAVFPRCTFRSRLAAATRNQGILSYQYLRRYDQGNAKFGDEVNPHTFFIGPVTRLQFPKMLRDRGLKLIHSGFTELKFSEEIQRQRLDAWMAAWQLRIDSSRSEIDCEIARMQSRMMAEAQRGIQVQF